MGLIRSSSHYKRLFRFDSYDHQDDEFELWRDARARALLWQMRTGKSKAMVDLACYLWCEGRIDGVFLSAPNGVHENWSLRELPRHMWEGIGYSSLVWNSQIVKRIYFKDRVKGFVADRSDFNLPWLMINDETLTSKQVYATIKRFFKGRRILMIVDECDDFRSPGSKRTKRMRAIARYTAFTRILTGTVVSNTPLAAFSQFELLEKGALGFDNMEDYEDHFAEYEMVTTRGGRQYPSLVKYINLDELTASIAEWSSVVLRSDVKGLSELIPGQRVAHMTEQQQEAYNNMMDGLMDEPDMDEDEIEPFTGGAKLTKLQQIVSGFLIGRDGVVRDLCPEGNPRIQALIDQINEEDGKIIIWCRFKEDIRQVAAALRALGRNVVEYHGSISKKQKLKNLQAFQEDPTVTDLVGQPQAGGRGRDMSAANQMIWYSHTFDLILREQASERATKVGKGAVAVTDIRVPGTVDDYTLENLEEKRSISDDVAGRGLQAVLEDLRQRWLSVTQEGSTK